MHTLAGVRDVAKRPRIAIGDPTKAPCTDPLGLGTDLNPRPKASEF